MFKKGTYQFNREPNFNSLARKAEEEGRTEAQIGYLRMSEFFMYDSDPEKVKTYRRARAGRRFARTEYEVRSCVGETGHFANARKGPGTVFRLFPVFYYAVFFPVRYGSEYAVSI